jgi:PKD repeat protein
MMVTPSIIHAMKRTFSVFLRAALPALVVFHAVLSPGQVITEIMYNPPESGTDSLEYVELANPGSQALNMAGFHFSSGIGFTFPGFILLPGQCIVLAADSAAVMATLGCFAFEYAGALSNSGEALVLRDADGTVVDSVFYEDSPPWPVQPDGTGPSLRFCHPEEDNSLPDGWSVSDEFLAVNAAGDSIWGSPGGGCILLPVPDFTADTTILAIGGTVLFTDLSSNEPGEWVWTFPGGSPGAFNGKNPPPVTYDDPGSYDVALWVSNSSGEALEVKEDYILAGVPPEAGIQAWPTSLLSGDSAVFADASSGNPESWSWSFEGGDPPYSHLQHPGAVYYDTPGIFDVQLIVGNLFGSDTLLLEDHIDVIPVGTDERPDNGLGIRPNPNQGCFNLVNQGSRPCLVDLADASGRLIMKGRINPGGSLPVSVQSGPGVYYLRVSSSRSGEGYTCKIIIH